MRLLRDMKGSIEPTELDTDSLADHGRLCGAVLARAYCRAGDASAIASQGQHPRLEYSEIAWNFRSVDRLLSAQTAGGAVPASTVHDIYQYFEGGALP